MSYLLFAGEDYYPSGGMQDYWGTFETIEEAKNEQHIYETLQLG